MRDRYEKRFNRLSAQVPSGFIDHGARDHQRHAASGFLKCIRDSKQRSLSVECVENSFDNEKIDTAFEQRFRLVEISLAKLIE